MGQQEQRELSIEMQRQIAATPATVWGLILREDSMRQWLNPRVYEPRPGGRVLFDVLHGETRWLMFGNVTVVDQQRRLAFTWQEFNCTTLAVWPLPTLVSIELAAVNDGTLVTLRHSGFEALPDAKEQYAQYQEGWQSFNGLDELERLCLAPEI